MVYKIMQIFLLVCVIIISERGKEIKTMKIITINKETGFSKRVLTKKNWVNRYIEMINKGIAKEIATNRYELNGQIIAIMND